MLYAAFVASLFALPSIIQWTFFPEASAAAEETTTGHPASAPSKPAEATVRGGPGITVPQVEAIVAAVLDYVMSLVTAAAVGLIFFFPLQRFVSRHLNDSRAAFQHQLDKIAQHSSTMHERLPPSVFLKPIGDEAALALTWTSAMAALMQGASTLLFLSLQWVRDRWTRMPRKLRIVGGLLLTAAWSVGTMGLEIAVLKEHSLAGALAWIWRDALKSESMFTVALIWALLTWAAALLMLLALVVVLLVALLAAAGAGVPSLKTALYFRISVEAIPVGSHQLVLVDVSSPPILASDRVPPGRLSHSALYNSPGAIRAVIDAISSFETARAIVDTKSGPPLPG